MSLPGPGQPVACLMRLTATRTRPKYAAAATAPQTMLSEAILRASERGLLLLKGMGDLLCLLCLLALREPLNLLVPWPSDGCGRATTPIPITRQPARRYRPV